MKTLPGLLLALVGAGLLIAPPVQAVDDDLDADTKAALDAAKKAAEKSGIKMPDIKKMMEDSDDEDTTPKKPAAKEKTPAKKDAAKTPLTSVPEWIPPVPGLKLLPGGKKWTEEEVEHGELSGIAAGTPREIGEAWKKAAQEVFRGVVTNDNTINGAVSVRVFATYLKEEQLEHRVELELKPAKGGKTTEVKLTYTIAGEP